MASSPPLSQLPKFPVSAGLGLIALGLFVAIGDLSDRSTDALIEPFVMDGRTFWAEPWRLLTSALVHGDFVHVGFNVLWMWLLGTYVETNFGHLRALGLMVVLAVGSGAAQYAVSDGGVGLSGVVYGLFGFLWALDRYVPRHRGAISRLATRLFVAWFFLCIVMDHLTPYPLGVANTAHGVGAVLGGLIGFVYAFRGGRRYAAALGLVAAMALSLVGATQLRTQINPVAAFDEGLTALEEERYEDAIAAFERATDTERTGAPAWFNIGLCKMRLHDVDGALSAFRRALALQPGNAKFQDKVDALEKAQALAEAGTGTGTEGGG